MRRDERRFLVLGRDLEFIYRQIGSAKARLASDTPEWMDLERAEARFHTLALFAMPPSESPRNEPGVTRPSRVEH